jgi:phosphoenolpyruvate synthase/pyruvate phosphate dikinase
VSLIKSFEAIKENEVDLVGGKALSLGRLSQAGLPVPNGFVITTAAYHDSITKGMSIELEEVILKAFDRLGADHVAVRSSAIAEDSVDASWAGQFETYLNVGREELISSIKQCWQSAQSKTVNAYGKLHKASNDQRALAVVIQKMVASEIAGVAFSVNPLSKDNDEIMIEAIYGLGELLVQGKIIPDNYVIQKDTLEVIEKHISQKSNMLIYEDHKNVAQLVLEKKKDEPCLDDSQLVHLAELILGVEKYFGKPQDIEWAFEEGTFYIVQSRPITTI